MFRQIEILKSEILQLSPEDFVNRHLSGGHSKYFDEDRLAFFCDKISYEFDVDLTPEYVALAGSAKLGYALHEKIDSKGVRLQPFRPFRPESDIDLTVFHPDLFKRFWFELTEYACRQSVMPWRHGNLADYLLYGWLRPDKFPKGVALTRCDKFYETIGELRRNRAKGHPKLSVALFFSEEQLKKYQLKSIRTCRAMLEAL